MLINFTLKQFLLLSWTHQQSCCGSSGSSSLGNFFSLVSMVYDLAPSLFMKAITASWPFFSLCKFISVFEDFTEFCPALLVALLWLIILSFPSSYLCSVSFPFGVCLSVCFMLDLLCFTVRVAGVGSLAAPSGRWQRFRLAKEADGSLLGKQSETRACDLRPDGTITPMCECATQQKTGKEPGKET